MSFNFDEWVQLYKESPFLFEQKRKKLIQELIESADPEYREDLLKLQERWDNAMQHAGNKHNRLVIAQTLFYEQLNRFRSVLNEFASRRDYNINM